MNIQDLPIKKIERDESTQARVRTDDDVAGEYAEVLENLPPPVVFFDGGKYWLGDGWHTVRAHELKRKKIVRCEVREGTRRDAIIYAAGANARHGLRRTNADKRRAIWLLLQHCRGWSNRQIADHCHVDHKTVGTLKQHMKIDSGEIPQTIEVADAQPENVDLVDSLSPAERAAWEAMTPEEQQQTLKEAEADTLDERLAACEVVIFRIEKRLGDDDIGKSIRNELKLFRVHMRAAVGWEEAKRTVVDEAFRERCLQDIDRLRKLNAGVPGERPRVSILDRLTAKVKNSQ